MEELYRIVEEYVWGKMVTTPKTRRSIIAEVGFPTPAPTKVSGDNKALASLIRRDIGS